MQCSSSVTGTTNNSNASPQVAAWVLSGKADSADMRYSSYAVSPLQSLCLHELLMQWRSAEGKLKLYVTACVLCCPAYFNSVSSPSRTYHTLNNELRSVYDWVPCFFLSRKKKKKPLLTPCSAVWEMESFQKGPCGKQTVTLWASIWLICFWYEAFPGKAQ